MPPDNVTTRSATVRPLESGTPPPGHATRRASVPAVPPSPAGSEHPVPPADAGSQAERHPATSSGSTIPHHSPEPPLLEDHIPPVALGQTAGHKNS